MYPLALHIFRRDLRLHDNSALIEALKLSHKVIPCFIFDERQIDTNTFKSQHCIQFMINSLTELDKELNKKKSKLYLFYGIAEDIVLQLLTHLNINAVFINRDYTPFSRARDLKIAKICRELSIDFHCYADALLHEPEEITTSDHKPYSIFTPFYQKSVQLSVAKPKINLHEHYYQKPISFENRQPLQKMFCNQSMAVHGGRNEALLLLKKIKNLGNYEFVRNFPALQGTTQLSAHNKFGTLSIREFYTEVYKHFGKDHSLLKELYWRDFFTHIIFYYPQVLGASFKKQYTNLSWHKNQKHFQAWCEGKTGFPIVDAGMRELNATGYMHNRVRMITASFLIKDLHIDWRVGEQYFATKLIDYDPAINNGNWQWVASTGCDAQPYFRIFNPWLQQQKFDAECLYIKKWLPELAWVPAKMIHRFNKHPEKVDNYPRPIIDHTIESQKTKLMYKSTKI